LLVGYSLLWRILIKILTSDEMVTSISTTLGTLANDDTLLPKYEMISSWKIAQVTNLFQLVIVLLSSSKVHINCAHERHENTET